MIDRCPACGSEQLKPFYSVSQVPAHSVVLLPTRRQALDFPKGDIQLALCRACGFAFNQAFDASLQDYSAEYESTQGYSPTFNRFADELAGRLVEQFDLRGARIIEIGCGEGEFLASLCEKSGSTGLGFDPSYDPARTVRPLPTGVTVIKDYYSEKYAGQPADFIVCKMTLEHILPVRDFIQTVRRAVGDRPQTTVFFQVPNLMRLLEEAAFWDIYYEHCSYFSPGALARLFRACGFIVRDLWTGYDDQYLMIAAQPGVDENPARDAEETPAALEQAIDDFSRRVSDARHAWESLVCNAHAAGQEVALWGAGSKAVAFLTTLKIRDEIRRAVDINPVKRGTYLPGNGQAVIAPADLAAQPPERVILMNPVYIEEVRQALSRLGLSPALSALGRESA